ncbi:hypothetical protein FB451DRAFT_1244457 [Mycena latifolia]|nr:hypothetical protein FB451DRAFT_1244457 [Mycena latifolia]
MSKNAAVKTLYTAKFFEAPSSSDSTNPPSSKPQPSAYLEGLFQTHVALNQMEEVPDSRPNTPDRVDPERVEALRKQVVEAYNAAKNPASGKWGILANLLQTGTAKGKYRYPGPEGWLLPDTEEEWFAYEKKRKEERRRAEIKQKEEQLLAEKRRKDDEVSKETLNERIETWQRSMDPIPQSDIDTRVEPTKAHARKGSSSRPAKSTPLHLDGAKPPSKSDTTASRRSLKPHARNIVDLPEATFLPPSFPSNLKTSTPTTNRQKPSPIVLVPPSSTLSSPTKKLLDFPGPSSSTLSSPTKRPVDVPGPSFHDRIKSPNLLSKVSPADEIPSSSPLSTPPKNSRVYGRPRLSESPLKRARSSSPTPLSAAKKPRAALPSSPVPASGSAAPSSPSPSKPASNAPFTPPRNPLPQLADLIAASAQKKSKTKAKEREKQKGKSKEQQQPVPPPKPKSESPPSHLVDDQEELDRETSGSPDGEQGRLNKEAGIGVMEDDVMNWDYALEKVTADGNASPSKSLSSIDGSNSLESHESMDMPDFSHGAPFDPQAGSTQPMGMLEGGESMTTTQRGGRGYGQPVDYYPMAYESQMDVESNLQGVEQLLNADVAGPWMGRGPDDEDEDQWGDRGSGQIDSSP